MFRIPKAAIARKKIKKINSRNPKQEFKEARDKMNRNILMSIDNGRTCAICGVRGLDSNIINNLLQYYKEKGYRTELTGRGGMVVSW